MRKAGFLGIERWAKRGERIEIKRKTEQRKRKRKKLT
jgi:hypothetical protein